MIDLECKKGDHEKCTQKADCPCQHRETVEIVRGGVIYTAPKGVTAVVDNQ